MFSEVWNWAGISDRKICQLLEGREYLIFYFGFYISVALYQATRSYKYKLIKSSKQPYEVSTILFPPGSLVSVFITLPGSLPWRQTDLRVSVPVHFLFLVQTGIRRTSVVWKLCDGRSRRQHQGLRQAPLNRLFRFVFLSRNQSQPLQVQSPQVKSKKCPWRE